MAEFCKCNVEDAELLNRSQLKAWEDPEHFRCTVCGLPVAPPNALSHRPLDEVLEKTHTRETEK